MVSASLQIEFSSTNEFPQVTNLRIVHTHFYIEEERHHINEEIRTFSPSMLLERSFPNRLIQPIEIIDDWLVPLILHLLFNTMSIPFFLPSSSSTMSVSNNRPMKGS